MSRILLGLVVGLAVGGAAVVSFCAWLVERRARRLFERWLGQDRQRAVRREVDRHRAEVKEHVGGELAPQLATFPFEPADVRFLGHPAHFVVFDGHTDVKDRRQGELRAVVFVTVRSRQADLSDAALIDECLAGGRVRWLTLRAGASPELPSPHP